MIAQNHAKHEHLYELNGTPVQVEWSLVTTEWLQNHCGWQNKDAQVFVSADPTTLFSKISELVSNQVTYTAGLEAHPELEGQSLC